MRVGLRCLRGVFLYVTCSLRVESRLWAVGAVLCDVGAGPVF